MLWGLGGKAGPLPYCPHHWLGWWTRSLLLGGRLAMLGGWTVPTLRTPAFSLRLSQRRRTRRRRMRLRTWATQRSTLTMCHPSVSAWPPLPLACPGHPQQTSGLLLCGP